MGRAEGEPGHLRDDAGDVVYVNVVRLGAGPFDLQMDFGYRTPEEAASGSVDFVPKVRLAMSQSHAKSMLPLLAKVIAEIERQVGPIPAPGFEDLGKA